MPRPDTRAVIVAVAGLLCSIIGAVVADTPTAAGEPYAESAVGHQQSPASPTTEAAAQQDRPLTHVVQAGDTLWALARKHGVPVRTLAHANGLSLDSTLPLGLRLTVPTTEEEPAQDLYVVQKGDCLWRIARRYGTTAGALADMNGLQLDAVLPVGIRLTIPAAPRSGSTEGNSFVQTAMKYRGVRYRYGGMTTRGMDCSGLVARVLAVHGIDAPHNSSALYKLGRQVSRTELQSGDLVFFNTNGRGISHVGIYVGEGDFIHASSGRGRVRVDSLEKGYYYRNYVGARRLD